LNNTQNYTYEGQGMLRNEDTNSYVESQTEKIKPNYIMIKALESGVNCAISGLHGQNYRIHELQHVYFARARGEHILHFRNNSSNKLLRFLVQTGRGYFIVDSSKCIDMETNMDLPLYENEDDENVIEYEAKVYNDFIKRNKEKEMLQLITTTY